MEVAGVEPASEKPQRKPSTRLVSVFVSHGAFPVTGLRRTSHVEFRAASHGIRQRYPAKFKF